MLRKVAATWLLVLALSPFTAPFSTCDLVSLIAGSAAHELSSPMSAASVTRLRTDATFSRVVTIRRDVARAKSLALFGRVSSQTEPKCDLVTLGVSGAPGSVTTSSPLQAVLRI